MQCEQDSGLRQNQYLCGEPYLTASFRALDGRLVECHVHEWPLFQHIHEARSRDPWSNMDPREGCWRSFMK